MSVIVKIYKIVEYKNNSTHKVKYIGDVVMHISESIKIQRYNTNDAWVLEHYGPDHFACN